MDHVSLPSVVQMQGSDIVAMTKASPPIAVPHLARLGLVQTTMREHERMLKTLSSIPADLLAAPATTAISTHLTRTAIERKWRASTLLKYLCTAQGVMALLPLYRRTPAVQLNTCPIWRIAIKGATIRCKEELPQQPRPASLQEVRQCLRSEQSLPLFAAILITWLTCNRTGCVLQLSREDVELSADGRMSVRFRRGKGVRVRGPYTVHTKVDEMFLPRLQQWLQQRRGRLFSMVTGTQIKLSLRKVNAQLEQRSLRRGSLQLLSTAPGITDQLLLEFSGHTSVKTLRRYLSWGRQAAHLQTAMQSVPTIQFSS